MMTIFLLAMRFPATTQTIYLLLQGNYEPDAQPLLNNDTSSPGRPLLANLWSYAAGGDFIAGENAKRVQIAGPNVCILLSIIAPCGLLVGCVEIKRKRSPGMWVNFCPLCPLPQQIAGHPRWRANCSEFCHAFAPEHLRDRSVESRSSSIVQDCCGCSLVALRFAFFRGV